MPFSDPDTLIDSLLYDLVVSEDRRADAEERLARLVTRESDLAVCAEHLADALSERDAYRLLSHVAIGRIADLTAERDKLQRRVTQLLQTARGLRQAA